MGQQSKFCRKADCLLCLSFNAMMHHSYVLIVLFLSADKQGTNWLQAELPNAKLKASG